MSTQRIPVTVVGGYLGAGKTTLVNHALRSSSERVAVIVNDFGEVSIDEDLIVAADSDKLTLANGCICCTLADGFAVALNTVRSAAEPPERLLIEASGVADPAQVAAYGHTPGLRLDAVVVMADAEQVRRQASDRWVADIVRMQLAAADLLVVNKTDLLDSAADTDSLCDWLTGLAGGAAVVRASRAEVPVDLVFGLHTDLAGGMHAPVRSAAPPIGQGFEAAADDLFESQTVVLDAPVPMPTIESLLAELPKVIVRLKGIVGIVPNSSVADTHDDESATDYLIQAVGSRTELTPLAASSNATPRRCAVSLIARKGSLDSDWLRDRLGTGR